MYKSQSVMCFFRYDIKDFCIFFFVFQKEVLSLPPPNEVKRLGAWEQWVE